MKATVSSSSFPSLAKVILPLWLVVAHPMGCRADLFEDQRKLLKDQRDQAMIEVNRQYAEKLALLLEKVRANKDEALAIKIRQEMSDIGFPHQDDWLLGTWVVDHSDDFKRTYVFAANGTVRLTRYEGGTTADTNNLGTYSQQPDGSYRVTFEKSLLFFSRLPQGGIAVTRWNDLNDYPDKSKMIKGTAKSRVEAVSK